MGDTINKKIKTGDPASAIPSSFYNNVDEILTGLTVFGGSITKNGNDWVITPAVSTAGGTASALGYTIYYADETWLTIPLATAMAGYVEGTDTTWSLEFEVTGGVLTGIYTTEDTGTDLFDGNAATSTAQSFYRIPIVRESTAVSLGGTYRENTKCAGAKGPIVELIKVG